MANASTELNNKSNGSGYDLKSKVQNTERKFEQMAHEAGEKVGTLASDVANTASEAVKSGRDYITDSPARGVIIAAAVGAVVGSLITMAIRRKD